MFSKILVPIDFSPHSDHALEWAIGLAKNSGGSLELVHAIHMPHDIQMTGEWWATLRARAVERLDVCIDEADRAGVPCEAHLLDEPPAEAILKAAESSHADLIVMGSHGRGALGHLLLGGVASKVLRLSEIPVLTLRKES
jgi:nucleotide-binding universal stress UspA family protein